MNAGALYPGTFDPITRGHEDLIRRAARLFDRIVVAVAASPKKTPLLPLAERIRLAREVLADVAGIEVVGYEGLTVDVARQNGLAAIVRGIRTAADFEFESQLGAMNAVLDDGVQTILLPASPALSFVSSTLVREIAGLGGDVTAFVRAPVAEALRTALADGVSSRDTESRT